MVTRRQILQSAVAPIIVPSLVLGQRSGAVAPSDKIVFGGIGIGSRGAHDLSKILNIPDARFVAICDVRNERREDIKATVDKKYGDHGCQMYDDQYALLARRDIDAVLMATGDRWHTPLAIIAAQHGKICRDLSIQKGKLLKFRSRKLSQPVLIRSGKQQSQPVPMRLALTNPLVR